MFKNFQLFRIAPTWDQDLAAIQSALGAGRFLECGPSQASSLGWIEPRGEDNAALAESVAEQIILKVKFEAKVLPGAVVKEELDKRSLAIEGSTGRKPGKKEKKDLLEEIRLELLSKAFTKKSAAFVWIDPASRTLVIESTASSRSDAVISLLVKSLDGFAITPIMTNQSPVACMTTWLLDSESIPSGFTADRDCELKATDESRASVRYSKHALDTAEVQKQIQAGLTPVTLAMTWKDRVSFVLTENSTIKKVEFLDVVMDEKTSATGKDSGFDADAAIATGELKLLVVDLLNALGGESDGSASGPTQPQA